MNKSKQIAFASVLICFYLIAKMVPLNFNVLPKSGIILGFAFIFIKKKYRIIATTVYQLFGIGTIISLIGSLEPSMIYNIINLALNEATKTPPIQENTTITPIIMILLYIQILYPSAITIFGLIVFEIGLIICIIGILFDLFLWLLLFTAPYSVYFIFKKIGFYELVNKRTGNRFSEVLS